MQIETTVLGGLRVTVEFTVCPADPSVGILEDYVDEGYIVAVCGRACKKPPMWLYRRIKETPGEEERIFSDCLEAYLAAKRDEIIELGEYRAEIKGLMR